jgi:hypothetical protein
LLQRLLFFPVSVTEVTSQPGAAQSFPRTGILLLRDCLKLAILRVLEVDKSEGSETTAACPLPGKHAPETPSHAYPIGLTWIGNAGAVLFGQHGDITAQTQQAGSSRQVAYQHAHRVQQAVADAQRPGPAYQQVLQHNEQLRQENQQLGEALDVSVDFPQARQRQFTTTAAAMGHSLAQSLTLSAHRPVAATLPLPRPAGALGPPVGPTGPLRPEGLDEACRPLVACLCLDEISFRRQPVLMGVEPHSLAWVLAERAPDRSGPTWAKALAAWPSVPDVAADGGSGLKLGLELAAAKRQEDAAKANRQAPAAGPVPAPAVPLPIGLDVFHIRREGERALR